MLPPRYSQRLVLLAAFAGLVSACGKANDSRADASAARPSSSSAPAAPPSAEAPASAASSASPASSVSDNPPAKTEGCDDGMVRVEGSYCNVVLHKCVEHHKEYQRNKSDKNVSERCLRYEEHPTCFQDKHTQLAFCMDRFEYPNKRGELPWVLTSWRQAKSLCEQQGKRLCTEDEHNFACEGPEMLPYAYGFVRDAEKCNIDREYTRPDLSHRMLTYEKCQTDERCSAELKRLDQRHAIGARMTCVSWAGVVDINGNVNEWVDLPGKTPPNRSGLKGGWWGPVRSRCRPTVTFHKEEDYGYEAGFRCCKDVKP